MKDFVNAKAELAADNSAVSPLSIECPSGISADAPAELGEGNSPVSSSLTIQCASEISAVARVLALPLPMSDAYFTGEVERVFEGTAIPTGPRGAEIAEMADFERFLANHRPQARPIPQKDTALKS